MKTNNRTYTTLRIFRGRNRNNELVKLADAQKDFEYRRLLIEEREIDLHVFFSREKISEIISWILILFSIMFYVLPILSIFLFLSSLFFQIFKHYWRWRFIQRFKMYMFSLKIVDSVIFNDYGISLS